MSKTGRHQAEALLGDLLVRSKISPRGTPPTDEELALLCEGSLKAARREEVISHLLNDPLRYRQWLDLCEMAEDTMPALAQHRRLSELLYDWFEHWQFAAATASALAAMLVFTVYVGMQPPQGGKVTTLTDTAGLQKLSKPAAPSPGAAFSREPAERELRAKQQLAESARQSEPQAMADTQSPELSMDALPQPQSCLALMHPFEPQSPGWLCLVDQRHWQWQAEATDDASPQTLDNLDDRGIKENPRLSADQRWLAYVGFREGHYELMIVSIAGLFGDNIRSYHFDPETYGIDYRWDDNELLIYSQKQFMPSSDSELAEEAKAAEQPQRFDPETGEFIQP